MTSGQGPQQSKPPALQSRSSGFGPPAAPGRPRTKTEDLTDMIDDMVIENGPMMTAMALQALTDGMRSRVLKERIDAAKSFLHNFHNPAKRLDVDVQEQVTISAAAREATDQLTPEEQAVMDAFEARLRSLRENVIDVEVIDETPAPTAELPPPTPVADPIPTQAAEPLPALPTLPPPPPAEGTYP